MKLAYFDASALVKLVMSEPESAGLREYLASARREGLQAVVSSRISHVEVVRAVMKRSPRLLSTALGVLRGVHLISVSESVMSVAGRLDPAALRALDAIHVATALQEDRSVRHVVTYDERMVEACRGAGLDVVSPR